MNRMKKLHPVTLLLFYCSVLCVGMFSMNPIYCSLSLTGAVTALLTDTPLKRNTKSPAMYFLLCIGLAVTNPLFSHNGITVLFYIGNTPYTLEALLYGINIGIMLIGTLLWFKIITNTFSDDKFLFIFGKAFPTLTLTLTVALRFIPLFTDKIKKAEQYQKALGITEKNPLKASVKVFSIIITNSFENALQTSQSMLSRGYGSKKGRSDFSIFKFGVTDGIITVFTAAAATLTLFGISRGLTAFEFYPAIDLSADKPLIITAIYSLYGILVFLPTVLKIKECLKWKFFASKM